MRTKYWEFIEVTEAKPRPHGPQADNLTLVRQAVNGDSDAFGQLYLIYVDRIYRYVFYHVMDRMTAEDITEEVFLKSWKAIQQCEGREQTFSSWLYKIAHNQVIDDHRRHKDHVCLDSEEFAVLGDAEQEAVTCIERQELLEAVSRLHHDQKQVIILKFIDGLSNQEITKITGKSQGAIRILQMRALANIRRKMAKEG